MRAEAPLDILTDDGEDHRISNVHSPRSKREEGSEGGGRLTASWKPTCKSQLIASFIFRSYGQQEKTPINTRPIQKRQIKVDKVLTLT